MSAGTDLDSRPRRSVRVAVILASTGVALCFVAAFGLIQQPLKAEPVQVDAITD